MVTILMMSAKTTIPGLCGKRVTTNVAKGLQLKVRKFWGPNPTFVEVTGEKLVGGLFAPHPE